jgi:hypothetical protein
MIRAWLVMSVALGVTSIGVSSSTADQSGYQKTIKVAEPMAFVRLYADSSGASHFGDGELTFALADFAPPAPPISVSSAIQSESALVISSPVGWEGDWHPAPRRQYLIVLTGELEVKVSDGDVLLEDTWGKGHVSRVIGDVRAYALVVPLKKR